MANERCDWGEKNINRLNETFTTVREKFASSHTLLKELAAQFSEFKVKYDRDTEKSERQIEKLEDKIETLEKSIGKVNLTASINKVKLVWLGCGSGLGGYGVGNLITFLIKHYSGS